MLRLLLSLCAIALGLLAIGCSQNSAEDSPPLQEVPKVKTAPPSNASEVYVDDPKSRKKFGMQPGQ